MSEILTVLVRLVMSIHLYKRKWIVSDEMQVLIPSVFPILRQLPGIVMSYYKVFGIEWTSVVHRVSEKETKGSDMK